MFSEKIVMELCNGNPEKEKKLRVLMLEVEVMRQDGRTAPDNMTIFHWEHLLELKSRNQRASYLTYLWKNEMSKINLKVCMYLLYYIDIKKFTYSFYENIYLKKNQE